MIKILCYYSYFFCDFSTSDWINSISAISAILTAIVTLITVREIKKQREHSYHPDINLANIDFFVYKYDNEVTDDDTEEDYSLFLFYSKIKMDENQSIDGYNELTIDINNIGLAVAKQVKWKWEMNFNEIQNLFHSNHDDIDFLISEEELSVNFEEFDIDWMYLINDENSSDYFNFILPYQVENRKTEIRIPPSFIDLFWLHSAKNVTTENFNSQESFPSLQLHLEYMNMHNKLIKKTFYLILKWKFISNPLHPQKQMAKFSLNVIEKYNN